LGYKNILVTLDGSLLAEQALRHVAVLAEPGAVIHVLSVVTNEPVDVVTAIARSSAYLSPVMDPEVLADLTERDAQDKSQLLSNRKGYLEQITALLVESGYTVTLDVRFGDVLKTIVDTARDGYDVIIMATHGRTGLSKVFLGSVAEAVLHQAPCPVLLIPVRVTEQVKPEHAKQGTH
jgi:nucleotide-binding universal stress UspA family protein